MKQWKKRGVAVWLLLMMLLGVLGFGVDGYAKGSAAGTLEVHFIDIGQGDATLLIQGEHAMLIDAGNQNKGTAVQSYLKKQGIKKLDYVIGTHPDADHIGGLDVVLYKFDCETIFLPDYRKDTKACEEVDAALKEKRYTATQPKVGSEYAFGDATFTVLAPTKGEKSDVNDYSIAIRMTYGKTSFLFTGDAGEESEEEMLESAKTLKSQVYKVSHHGSRTATSEDFLERVNPTYAVISCGEGNSYGHPHAEVMNRLRENGVKVFRTDEQGTVVATSNGKKISWNTSPDESWKTGEAKGTSSDLESTKKATSTTASSRSTAKTEGSYVLNTNTKKIHLATCSSVENMAKKNKEVTSDSLSTLLEKGYTTCQRCMGE
jgi:competence protein ComEC